MLPCAGTGIIYESFPNGHVVFQFAGSMPDGTQAGVAFAGESDRQVRPEDYVLYLSRVHYLANGGVRTWDVSGTCRVSMNVAGTLWSQILCDATDADRRRYTVDFRGNGRPVDRR